MLGPLMQSFSLGSGTFPDVAWHAGAWWLVGQQAGVLNVYRWTGTFEGVTKARAIGLPPDELAYARLSSFQGRLWCAYRAGPGWLFDAADPNLVPLELGPAGGVFPFGFGAGCLAWRGGTGRTLIMPLPNGPTVGHTRETSQGIERIELIDGLPRVIYRDDTNHVESWGSRASQGGALTVCEGPTSGVRGRWTDLPAKQVTIWPDDETPDPHAAEGPEGLFAVCTWKPIRAALVTRQDADLLQADVTLPEAIRQPCDLVWFKEWPEYTTEGELRYPAYPRLPATATLLTRADEFRPAGQAGYRRAYIWHASSAPTALLTLISPGVAGWLCHAPTRDELTAQAARCRQRMRRWPVFGLLDDDVRGPQDPIPGVDIPVFEAYPRTARETPEAMEARLVDAIERSALPEVGLVLFSYDQLWASLEQVVAYAAAGVRVAARCPKVTRLFPFAANRSNGLRHVNAQGQTDYAPVLVPLYRQVRRLITRIPPIVRT